MKSNHFLQPSGTASPARPSTAMCAAARSEEGVVLPTRPGASHPQVGLANVIGIQQFPGGAGLDDPAVLDL
jgi:hypothetical protein